MEAKKHTKSMTEKNGGNSTGGVQWVDLCDGCTTQAVLRLGRYI
jgi:hypothetical protein